MWRPARQRCCWPKATPAGGTKLTTLSITDEDKENSQHQADSATATYGQAVADRDMARLNLERTTVRHP